MELINLCSDDEHSLEQLNPASHHAHYADAADSEAAGPSSAVPSKAATKKRRRQLVPLGSRTPPARPPLSELDNALESWNEHPAQPLDTQDVDVSESPPGKTARKTTNRGGDATTSTAAPKRPDEARSDKEQQRQEQRTAKDAAQQQKQLEKEEKRRAAAEAKQRKAEEKAARARDRAAASQAKGSKALQEIDVVVDSKLVLLPSGRQIVEALQGRDLRVSIEAGRVGDVHTVTWRRRLPSEVEGESAVVEVPYVLVVLEPERAAQLLASDSGLNELLRRVVKHHGPVTVSLLLLRLGKHLEKMERKEDAEARRLGAALPTFTKSVALERLMVLIFKHEGVSYRDVVDDAQAAEHVVALSAAMAQQPYKVADDWLAAHKYNSKQSESAQKVCWDEGLNQRQTSFAKALHALGSIPPKAAGAVAREHHSLGALMQHMLAIPEAQACKELAALSAGARRLGPAAAKRLHKFVTCDDPDAPFD